MPHDVERIEAGETLARAAAYEALALAFGPPGDERLARALEGGAAAHVAELLRDLGVEAPSAASAERLSGSAAGASVPALAERYEALFGHTSRGEVPPFETEYGPEGQLRQPHELADLGGFYAAFGLRMDPRAHERADHVRCQCEFMAFLAAKEVYAAEKGEREMLAAVRHGERLFLRDHLGRFAAAFAGRLARADRGGFYAAWGAVLRAVVEADCRRRALDVGPEEMALRPIADEPVPMACGGADGGEDRAAPCTTGASLPVLQG